MNNRYRRLMSTLRKNNPKSYLFEVITRMSRNTNLTKKEIQIAIKTLSSKENAKSVKWHKQNKRWRQ